MIEHIVTLRYVDACGHQDGFLADIDATLVKQILDISKVKWKTNVEFAASRVISGDVLKWRNGDRSIIGRS